MMSVIKSLANKSSKSDAPPSTGQGATKGGSEPSGKADKPRIDIERWLPSRWEDFVGNEEVIEHFRDDLLYGVRKRGDRSGYNTFLIGESRTGKTAIVNHTMKCIACLDFDFATYNPCGKCHNCRDVYHIFGNDEWENEIDYLEGSPRVVTPLRQHFIPIDCTSITESELNEKLKNLKESASTVRVVYLDEAHRLTRRHFDEKLLKPLEQMRLIWICSSAVIKFEDCENVPQLEKMFLNRFSYRFQTRKPTVAELVKWLTKRCLEWEIEVDQPGATLKSLAEKSHRVPGMALQVLNKAYKKRKKLLTKTLVDRHIFDFDDC